MTPGTETEQYWDERYINRDTPWDTGSITAPLKEYIDHLSDKTLRILIPGAGNAHEAEYIHLNGFVNVDVVDISHMPLRTLKERCPDFPESNLIHLDFFDLENSYDLILEQTFFCALPPERRKAYVMKTYELLVRGGLLAGVLFDAPLNDDRPPYGGNLTEYQELFLPLFKPLVMERCYNSIPPRMGRELFICLQK